MRLNVGELLDEHEDVCRWWVSSLSYENDVRADGELFQLAGESWKVRNTMRFLLGNLGDFDGSTDARAGRARRRLAGCVGAG